MAPRQQLSPNATFLDRRPVGADSAREVAASLSADPPFLDPKYFYDARGAQLFEAITRTPEYYLTRTEIALLRDKAAAMKAALPAHLALIEPGAGDCDKVRILLDCWQPDSYTPIEISRRCLLDATRRLAAAYPHIRFHAICADFLHAPDVSVVPTDGPPRPRLVFFPGSTIGNFEPAARADFLAGLRRLAGQRGYLLIGADLQKDPTLLNAAYNDASGHTAAFNRNALRHLNRRLGCGFELDAFEHEAFYNLRHRRIELHLRCHRRQLIELDGRRIPIPAGVAIHTENSCKFTVESFSRELWAAGFTPFSSWTDDHDLFSVHLARAR